MVGSLEKSVLFVENMKDFGYELDACSTVHVSHSVDMFGQTFQTGCVLTLNYDERGERLFGEVLHIVPQLEKEIVLVFLRVLCQMYFHPHLYAYAVKRTNEYRMINLSNAADVKPLHIISYNENLFVNPRYKIV